VIAASTTTSTRAAVTTAPVGMVDAATLGWSVHTGAMDVGTGAGSSAGVPVGAGVGVGSGAVGVVTGVSAGDEVGVGTGPGALSSAVVVGSGDGSGEGSEVSGAPGVGAVVVVGSGEGGTSTRRTTLPGAVRAGRSVGDPVIVASHRSVARPQPQRGSSGCRAQPRLGT
jgi:hypothetical protein